MPDEHPALEMNDLNILGYLNNFTNNSAIAIYRYRFEGRIKRHQIRERAIPDEFFHCCFSRAIKYRHDYFSVKVIQLAIVWFNYYDRPFGNGW